MYDSTQTEGLEYGCVIMPNMGMDIASMKKADLDVMSRMKNLYMELELEMIQTKI